MYYANHYGMNDGLISDLERTLNGEYNAIVCYEQLAKLADQEEERNRILEIRKDEIKHFHIFSHIYISLTGRQPRPQLTGPCPSDYAAGLNSSFKDEQNTNDFYRQVADKTLNPFIREQFKRAAADEQNHAVWFLYFLSRR
ncbi:ferritin-like domain-containing protein [Paenibacillus pinistramenti]|uniref:ferritin-like domain-containing protein n=1 Tax=Paenibacillus pinistramenti TaxID=1768003 RepID=UPI001108FBA1|nr:ferritin-like domain-containing protein [Paenibacillus pinistramenti]